MAASRSSAVPAAVGRTLRRDAWWLESVPVWILMGGFSVYATLRAFEGKFYEWGPYLSPFYSPLIDPHHHWWALSPALLILAFPLGFRATCYYYRKALYRAFLMDPPACAVGESPHRNYRGETNSRSSCKTSIATFSTGAFVFLCFLWYDAIRAFWFPEGHFRYRRGVAGAAGQHRVAELFTCSPAIRCGTWLAESWIASPAPLSTASAMARGRRPASSMNATCSLPGRV